MREVVEDEALASRCFTWREEAVVSHGERHELKPCRPSLGACDELVARSRLGVEQTRCLGVGHCQICGTERRHLVVCLASGQPHLGEAPSREHELATGRYRLEQRVEHCRRSGGLKNLSVVEDQDTWRAVGEESCDAGEQVLSQGAADARDRAELVVADRCDEVERGGNMPSEVHPVVVEQVEADPGEGASVGVVPQGDRGGFSVPSGRDHRDDGPAL